MILNKRILRQLLDNKVKYIGLVFLIVISVMAIVGFGNVEECIMYSINNASKECNREDGNFTLLKEIDKSTLLKIKNLGIDIEENFYSDYELESNKVIRLFKKRENINKIKIAKGNDIINYSDIVIDKSFAEANDLSIGSKIKIDKEDFDISGFGVAIDYVMISKNETEYPNHELFGIGFISEGKFSRLSNKNYVYSFKLNKNSSQVLQNILKKNCKLSSFILKKDNQRIMNIETELITNKSIAIILGIILSLMIGFIITISIINIIDKESSIIGTLYALGYKKQELIRHFMILPLVIVCVGAVGGYFSGFLLKDKLINLYVNIFTLPEISNKYSISLILMAVIMPVFLVLSINYILISKKLSASPLSILRKEKKNTDLIQIKIRFGGFITKFRIREFLREIGNSISLFIGLSISTLILVIAFSNVDSAKQYIEKVKSEAKIEYTYILKIPINVRENKDVEKVNITELEMTNKAISKKLKVTLEGINKNSNFYDLKIDDNDEGVYISYGVKKKFNINVGDIINLTDPQNNKSYYVRVKGVVDYYSGLTIFMNRFQMNSLMNKSKDYFNGYFSKKPLNINEDYLYSTVLNTDKIDAANNTLALTQNGSSILMIIAIMIASLVIFILMKFIIDKSTYNISLMKIFGFNKNEINRLYLKNHLYIIIIATIINMFIDLKIYSTLRYKLMANSPSYIEVVIAPISYLKILGIILLIYFIVKVILNIHIKNVSLNLVLKERE